MVQTNVEIQPQRSILSFQSGLNKARKTQQITILFLNTSKNYDLAKTQIDTKLKKIALGPERNLFLIDPIEVSRFANKTLCDC